MHASLRIYDVSGRLVVTLVNESRSAGPHEIVWQGVDAKGGQVSSGVYLYELRAGDFRESKRMVLVR